MFLKRSAKKGVILGTPFLFLFMLGCGSARQPTYIERIHDGLAYSQTTYKKTLEGFAEAQIQGKVTDEQMAKVIEVAGRYQATHNLVLTLAQEYVRDQNPDLQIRITTLSQSLDKIMIELIELLARFGVGA